MATPQTPSQGLTFSNVKPIAAPTESGSLTFSNVKPIAASPSPYDHIADVITEIENSQVKNNPGGLKQSGPYPTDSEGRTEYPTHQAGRQALINQLADINSGRSKYYKPGMSILDFAKVWAPDDPAHPHQSENWANNAASKFGLQITDPMPFPMTFSNVKPIAAQQPSQAPQHSGLLDYIHKWWEGQLPWQQGGPQPITSLASAKQQLLKQPAEEIFAPMGEAAKRIPGDISQLAGGLAELPQAQALTTGAVSPQTTTQALKQAFIGAGRTTGDIFGALGPFAVGPIAGGIAEPFLAAEELTPAELRLATGRAGLLAGGAFLGQPALQYGITKGAGALGAGPEVSEAAGQLGSILALPALEVPFLRGELARARGLEAERAARAQALLGTLPEARSAEEAPAVRAEKAAAPTMAEAAPQAAAQAQVAAYIAAQQAKAAAEAPPEAAQTPTGPLPAKPEAATAAPVLPPKVRKAYDTLQAAQRRAFMTQRRWGMIPGRVDLENERVERARNQFEKSLRKWARRQPPEVREQLASAFDKRGQAVGRLGEFLQAAAEHGKLLDELKVGQPRLVGEQRPGMMPTPEAAEIEKYAGGPALRELKVTTGEERLTDEQKARLAEARNKLKEKFPELATDTQPFISREKPHVAGGRVAVVDEGSRLKGFAERPKVPFSTPADAFDLRNREAQREVLEPKLLQRELGRGQISRPLTAEELAAIGSHLQENRARQYEHIAEAIRSQESGPALRATAPALGTPAEVAAAGAKTAKPPEVPVEPPAEKPSTTTPWIQSVSDESRQTAESVGFTEDHLSQIIQTINRSGLDNTFKARAFDYAMSQGKDAVSRGLSPRQALDRALKAVRTIKGEKGAVYLRGFGKREVPSALPETTKPLKGEELQDSEKVRLRARDQGFDAWHVTDNKPAGDYGWITPDGKTYVHVPTKAGLSEYGTHERAARMLGFERDSTIGGSATDAALEAGFIRRTNVNSFEVSGPGRSHFDQQLDAIDNIRIRERKSNLPVSIDYKPEPSTEHAKSVITHSIDYEPSQWPDKSFSEGVRAEIARTEAALKKSRLGERGAVPADILTAPISKLVAALKSRFDKAEMPTEDRLRAANAIGQEGDNPVETTLGRAKLKLAAAYTAWKGEPTTDSWQSAKEHLSAANQRAFIDNRTFAKDVKQGWPDPVMRAAAYIYGELGGRAEDIEAAAAKVPAGKHYKGMALSDLYEKAKNLPEDYKKLGDMVGNLLDSRWDIEHKLGLIEAYREDYLPHIVPNLRKLAGLLSENYYQPKYQAKLGFARQRTADTVGDLFSRGIDPVTIDIGHATALRLNASYRTVITKNLMESLRYDLRPDGRPSIVIQGVGNKLIGKAEELPDRVLVRPNARPEDTAGYKEITHPAARRWKWVSTANDGTKILVEGRMLAHPDIADELNNLLKKSWWRVAQNPLAKAGRMALGVSAKGKSVLLYGALFHQVQETNREIGWLWNKPGSWLSPEKVNPKDPVAIDAMEHGVSLYPEWHSLADWREGVGGGTLPKLQRGPEWAKRAINALPGLIDRHTDYVFTQLIPAMKLQVYKTALDVNTRLYGDELTGEQIKRLSAGQANNQFGELNYTTLARNPTVQDSLRLLLLAPDFLESQLRGAIGQGGALRPYGRAKLAAVLRIAATQYITARIANAALNKGDVHPESPFGIVINGREYIWRSEPSDWIHAAQDPRGFITYRENPYTTRTATEALSGKDQYGVKRSPIDQASDLLKEFTPIWAQMLFRNFSDVKESFASSVMSSFGLTSKVYHTPAERVLYGHRADTLTAPSADDLAREQIAWRVDDLVAKKDKASQAKARQLLKDSVRLKTIDSRQEQNIWRSANEPRILHFLQGVTDVKVLREAYKKASPDERRFIGPALEKAEAKHPGE